MSVSKFSSSALFWNNVRTGETLHSMACILSKSKYVNLLQNSDYLLMISDLHKPQNETHCAKTSLLGIMNYKVTPAFKQGLVVF